MAGGAAGAVAGGGGGGGGGGAGGDGIAERWCGICRKSYTCHRWWMSRHHQPRCLKERQEEDARVQQNAARDRGQRMATQRAKDRKKSKQENKKGTASSKSKAQNTKRSDN